MKIIALDRLKRAISAEPLQPHLLMQEMSEVWRLWKAGIIRECYGRTDAPGTVIVLECESVEEAERYVNNFSLSRAGLLEWSLLPLTAPYPLAALFDPKLKALPR